LLCEFLRQLLRAAILERRAEVERGEGRGGRVVEVEREGVIVVERE
jgi:hypothetical protein